MEWDRAKVDAAVSTLTDTLGTICDVAVEVKHGAKRVDPVRMAERIFWDPLGVVSEIIKNDGEGRDKVTITITPREE